VNARWGRSAHLTFLVFCFLANIIVTSMLLLGGAATVEALTGMDYRLASFLIPWGVIMYTACGGLQATFLASYFHTNIIFAILIIMIFLVYVKIYSSDQIYDYLDNTVTKTTAQCEAIFSDGNGTSFFTPGDYACGPVSGNHEGSYLTMRSSGGLMFGIIVSLQSMIPFWNSFTFSHLTKLSFRTLLETSVLSSLINPIGNRRLLHVLQPQRRDTFLEGTSFFFSL
jgi:urea-proton symporter